MNEIDFTPGDWQRIKDDYTAWWDGELKRPLVYFTNVYKGAAPTLPYGEFIPNYPPEMGPSQIVDKYVESQKGRVFPGDTFPYWCMNYGPGFLAAALGATLHSMPDTVWFEPPPGADIASLPVEFDAECPWWRHMLDLTRTAVERIGTTVQISYSDIGGNLDILAGLIGTEQMMLDLADRPSEVRAALGRITDVWKRAFDELDAIIARGCPGRIPWAPTWAPGRTYILQSDASYMISPEMCAEFVIPDIEACCEHIEYPFYHMDGVGQLAHLDLFLSVEKLRGVQWIPGDGKPGPAEWPEVLTRIRERGKLCQIEPSARGVLEICRTIGGAGFLMDIQEPMQPHEAKELFDEICRLSA